MWLWYRSVPVCTEHCSRINNPRVVLISRVVLNTPKYKDIKVILFQVGYSVNCMLNDVLISACLPFVRRGLVSRLSLSLYCLFQICHCFCCIDCTHDNKWCNIWDNLCVVCYLILM